MPHAEDPPNPAPTAPHDEIDPAAEVFAERRCWRCLKMFPGDAPASPSPTADFWLCAPCDASLIPERAGR